MILLLAAACAEDCDCPADAEAAASDSASDAASDSASTADTPEAADWPLSWEDDPCTGISAADSGYADTVARWSAQAPATTDGVVFVGSSSIRRWERLSTDLSGYDVVQRGFGGAWLSEVAAFAPELITAHEPRAVVVFAGTNDVAGGSPAEDVVTAYRCLAQQVWTGSGAVPLLFIGITPTPSRWHLHETSTAVNEAVAALASAHPGLHYIDIPSAFLQTGQPPDEALFVEDMLHLSEVGYALWTAVILPALAEVVSVSAGAAGNPDHPDAGARILVDLGPSNPEDGDHTASPDASGLTWNNWQAVDGGAQILAGEAVWNLQTTDGTASGISLVIGGGFLSNGLLNGGLQAPDSALLGDLAVADATEDFFYTDGPDSPGALTLTGLDPSRTYRLRLLGSRDWGSEDRVTRYTVTGAATVEATQQTSGAGLSGSYDGNTDELTTLAGLVPDPWGRLHLDVAIEAGSYAYLNLLELAVE